MPKRASGQKGIVDLEMLNTLNAEGCPICGGKFTLGETVVAAVGSWGSERRWVHEREAVWDRARKAYVER